MLRVDVVQYVMVVVVVCARVFCHVCVIVPVFGLSDLLIVWFLVCLIAVDINVSVCVVCVRANVLKLLNVCAGVYVVIVVCDCVCVFA